VCGVGTGLARGKDREWGLGWVDKWNMSAVGIKLDRGDGEDPNGWLLPTVIFFSSHSTLRHNEIEWECLILTV
jgi:hypothetical protein